MISARGWSLRTGIASRQATFGAALLGALLIAAIWITATVNIEADRSAEEASYRHGAGNLTRAFAEYAARSLDLVDELLVTLQREYEWTGTMDLSRYAGRYRGVVRLLARTDDAGNILDISEPDVAHSSVSDRDYFKRLRFVQEDVVIVGETVVGRLTGLPSFPVARRIRDRNGAFAGIVIAVVDPAYFGQLYEDLDLGTRGFLSLAGVDGKVRAHRAAYRLPLGYDASDSAAHRTAMRAAEGQFTTRSPIDNRELVYNFRHIPQYGLIAIIAASSEDVFAAFNDRRKARLMRATSGTMLVVLACLALAIMARRVDAERERERIANRLKTRFVAQVSHELRTPLHGILGFARYLERRVEDESARESASHIRKGGEHLLALVETLLDLAKIEAGQLELAPRPTDLAHLVNEVVAPHRVVATAKGLAFECTVDDGARRRVLCDATRVRSMLNNLLHNAVKFTDGGSVALRARREESSFVFEVSDTGRGIEPEDQAVIFERFRQGADDASELAGGWGLGLALVRELAERMGGEVSVSSRPGGGSTFVLRLPFTTVSGVEADDPPLKAVA